jgi:hypothetical protein
VARSAGLDGREITALWSRRPHAAGLVAERAMKFVAARPFGDPTRHPIQHFAAMAGLISLGSAKTTSARSPNIPAGIKAGAFFSGP